MSINELSPLLLGSRWSNTSSSKYFTKSVALLGIVGCAVAFSVYLIQSIPRSQSVVLKQSRYIDISTAQGSLRGYTLTSRQGRDYYAFYKVPYAKPPLGSLRFQDPQPAEGWNGLRDINQVAPQCIQKEKYSSVVMAVGEEDCLYANLYTPVVPGDGSRLPTMVYIHGGGLSDGNGSRYGADYFMDEDVVLVTFQYRLGSLGFLNNDDTDFPGNQGFKDQSMMLQWVKDNIEDFGGDPDRVLIFGNSAGSFAVGLQMVSPLSAGLFHRAISQSTAAIGIGFFDFEPTITVKEVATTLNCTNTTEPLLTCLQSKSAAEVAVVRTPKTIYAVSIERHQGANKFMPDTPYNLMAAGKSHPVPYIIGINNAEWVGQALGVLRFPEVTELANSNFSAVAGPMIDADLTPEEYEQVRQFYFEDKKISNDTLWNLTNLVSDRGIGHGSHVAAMLHNKVAPAFTYYLSKPPAKSYAEKAVPGFNAKELGIVSHADELQFMFLYYGYPEIPTTDPQYFKFSKYLVKLWAHFATTGDPTMDGVPWNKWESNKTFWIELNDVSGETHVVDERMRFWDGFSHKKLKYQA